MLTNKNHLVDIRKDTEELELQTGGFSVEEGFKSIHTSKIIAKDPLIITATISGEVVADVSGVPTTLRIERDADSYDTIFIAPFACEVISITEVHAGAVAATLDILNCGSGVAKASGNSMLAATFSLNTAIDTPQSKSGTDLNNYRLLATNERVVWKLSANAAVTSVHITMAIKPTGRGSYKL